jgi:hypothetical protein
VLSLSTISGGAADTTTFEVWDRGTDELLHARDIGVGDTFRLEHTHSVTGRLVVETFSVMDPTTIAIEELWFDAHGPNLPVGPERIGDHVTTFLQEDDGYRVLHHGRPLGTVPLMVGSPAVDHVLVFEDGQRLRLIDVAPPGARVELSVGTAR